MNPELRRHAWQELRLHELLVTPLVLGLLAGICVAASEAPAVALAYGAMAIFMTLTIGWGTMRAFASVSDEVRDRTWDFQRMTALPPAHMALGKVFGAPLLQWYIGGWCLLAFAFAAPRAGMTGVANTLVGLVAIAVLLHALGVTASVMSARSTLGPRSRRAGSVAALALLFNVLPLAVFVGHDGMERGMRWWGLHLQERTFAAASALAFAGWALSWACRAMARELREPARYGASAAFALFFGVWLAGRDAGEPARALFEGLAGAAAVFILATYLGVGAEPLTPVRLARLRGAARGRLRVPPWAVDAAAAVALGLAAFASSVANGVGTQAAWPAANATSLAATLALMAVRDAAITSCFTLSPRLRRPVGRATFYIALADLLLPLALLVTRNPEAASLVLPLLAYGFPGPDPVVTMALHAAAALAVLAFRMRRPPAPP